MRELESQWLSVDCSNSEALNSSAQCSAAEHCVNGSLHLF